MASKFRITALSSPPQSIDIQIRDSNTGVTMDLCKFDNNDLTDIDVFLANVNASVEYYYNQTNRYTIQGGGQVDVNGYKYIEIVDNLNLVEFSIINNSSPSTVQIDIYTDPAVLDIEVNTVVLSESITDSVNYVRATIETSKQGTLCTFNGISTPVNTNPFTIEVLRNSINSSVFSVTDGDSTGVSDVYFLPHLTSSNIEVSANSIGSTSDLLISNNYTITPSYLFTYSIDNVNFYDTPSFTGVNSSVDTIYVNDNLGVTVSKSFTATGYDPSIIDRVAVFTPSLQNSLIHVLRSENTFKNPKNTLSYEEDTQVNNKDFKQLFETTDGILTNQYRSSYESVNISMFDCSGVETLIVPNQITNNIGITDIRDTTIVEVTYNDRPFLGAQYVSGNTYDPITLQTDSSYYLGSIVPSFIEIGDYVQLEGLRWFKVIDIVYQDNTQTLVFDSLSSVYSSNIGDIVKGFNIYNKLDYEVYEYSIDLSTLNGDYYVTINATDSEFTNVSYQTEYFNVSTEQYNTYLLEYYSTKNNETNYSNGILNILRLRYQKRLTLVPSDTQEVEVTDTNAYLVDATYRDFYNLDLFPIPTNMVRKIGVAMTNDRVFINGLSVLKNKELDSTRVGLSNTYLLTVSFVETDNVIDYNRTNESVSLQNGTPLQIDDNSKGLLFIN